MLLTFLVVSDIESPLDRILKAGVKPILTALCSDRLAGVAEVTLGDRVRYVAAKSVLSKPPRMWGE